MTFIRIIQYRTCRLCRERDETANHIVNCNPLGIEQETEIWPYYQMEYAQIVTYWPSTQPSIKRCISVTKRKNNGSRWAINNNMTSTQTAWVSWRQDAEFRSSSREREGFGPSVTHGWATKPRWGRSAAMVERRTLGQNNSLSPSPVHLLHTTNINPFGNKVWEIYFYKEVCSFVHWGSSLLLTMFSHI